MDMLEGETQVRDYALERAIMLSDGVFAIAMTLMAFELRPPDNWDHTLNTLLPAMIEPFKAFFWSFVATAAFWLNHRRLFGTYRRADGPISIINLLFLGEVVLIPVATRVLTELSYSRASLTLYLGLFGLIGATNAASWIYAALLTDIVRPPRRSVAVVLSVALIYAVVPVAMTGLGIISAFPGLTWLLALMPLVMGGAAGLRTLAERFGQRKAAMPLPAGGAPGEVGHGSG